MQSQINPRKTKIVCTLGPVTSSKEKMTGLLEAGMDVARLNFSHGDHESHSRSIKDLREVSRQMGREVGILQDLAGPKIRLGILEPDEHKLETGGELRLFPGESSQGEAVAVNYPHLLQDVSLGDRLLMADGLVEVAVERITGEELICRVITGGVISSRKGVNLPTSGLRVPAFTDKDRRDLEMGLAAEVDFVALSFVRHEDDMQPVLDIINHQEHRPLLIAKIEKPQAVERFEQILTQVDGVMVARGDLGVEMPLEQVPVIQKRLIRLARQAGKVVITATQMLRSMMESPRPTRAEAADVANAILDGTDAVMLSDESAVGSHPLEAVRVMDRIARATEPSLDPVGFLKEGLSPLLPTGEAAISRAATWLAQDLNPAAIVASTSSGSTARLIARYRQPFPVVGMTPNRHTCRQLCLSWGVIPALIPRHDNSDEMFAMARTWMLGKGMAAPGDCLIITAGVPIGIPGTTNLVKVVTID